MYKRNSDNKKQRRRFVRCTIQSNGAFYEGAQPRLPRSSTCYPVLSQLLNDVLFCIKTHKTQY